MKNSRYLSTKGRGVRSSAWASWQVGHRRRKVSHLMYNRNGFAFPAGEFVPEILDWIVMIEEVYMDKFTTYQEGSLLTLLSGELSVK